MGDGCDKHEVHKGMEGEGEGGEEEKTKEAAEGAGG